MEQKKTTLLLIEDDDDDVFLIREILSGGNISLFPLQIDSANCLSAGLERLKKGDIDVVLLDLTLPDSQGFDTLQRVQAEFPHVPVVVLTALNDESLAVEAVSQGAQDYVVKGQLNRNFLLRTIRYALERHRIRRELDHTNDRLKQLALVDPLTGLLNRRGLQQVLSRHIKRASRSSDSDFLALLIDLDDFKRINDSLGHAVGDVVLTEISRKLKSSLRGSDYASRIGGDEFLLLLPETRMAEGIRVAEKVRLAISGSPIILASGKAIRATASLGLVAVSGSASSIDELLTETHLALSKSKRAGKNQVSYGLGNDSSDPTVDDITEVHRRLQFGDGFRALKHPIYRLIDMKRVGYEFLSRSAIKNFEMPDDFFRISLENNILTTVDHQCLKTCVAAAAAYLKPEMRLHLNLFPSTMIDIPIQHLMEELQAPLHPGKYCIEISEQQIIGDPSYLAKPVEEIKESGVLVAIDDVGFGRSCLESLILLEPDIIKIDKGCVIGISKDRARTRSLKRILNVAEVLNTEVVAEGIETKEDLEVLRELGVRYGQGYLLDRPQEVPLVSHPGKV